MKDFYDVYHLLKNHPVDPMVLEQAIRQTFERRETPAPEGHSLFLPGFYLNEDRNTIWQAWLRKAKLNEELAFPEVMALISSRLKPIYLRLP